MPQIKLYLQHIFSSFVFLFILIAGIFFSRNYLRGVLSDPQTYFGSTMSVFDIYYSIIAISLIVISVLLSYILYLLLTNKTRFELEIWNATKSMALSKEQFRRIYDSAPVPYIIVDKDALITDSNKATLRFFGVLPENIMGKNIFSFIAPESVEEGQKLYQYYKSKITFNRKEVQMITKSGAIRIVQLSIFEMRDPTTSHPSGLVMIFDITDEKNLDKQKTEFVSLASHQLRTPLATTKWYTEMLMSGDLGELDPKQKEYLVRLHMANKEMIELVDTLLNVSRIEMGALAIDKQMVNVEEIVESVLAELSVEIQNRGLHIEKQYNADLKNIDSDPKLLRIVIQNLISNSVKYTPNDGSIVIGFENTGLGRQISISDNGCGIPAEQQERIFTKLFRADNVRKLESSQGTGLGLYLVKSIIEGLGGTITFQSEENKGSVFTITL